MKFTIITIFKFSSIKYNIFILLYKHHHHSPPHPLTLPSPELFALVKVSLGKQKEELVECSSKYIKHKQKTKMNK